MNDDDSAMAINSADTDAHNIYRRLPPGCLLSGLTVVVLAVVGFVGLAISAPSILATAKASDVVSLAGHLAWPVALGLLAIYFSKPVVDLTERITKMNIEAGGTKISIDAEKAAAISASIAPLVGVGATGKPEESVESIAATAMRLATPKATRSLSGRRILWLVSRASTLRFLIQAFQTLGIQVDYRTALDDATAELQRRPYDVVISSMTLPDDKMAAYHLREQVAHIGRTVPFAIFSASPDLDPVDAASRGIAFVTSDPKALFDWVVARLT